MESIIIDMVINISPQLKLQYKYDSNNNYIFFWVLMLWKQLQYNLPLLSTHFCAKHSIIVLLSPHSGPLGGAHCIE